VQKLLPAAAIGIERRGDVRLLGKPPLLSIVMVAIGLWIRLGILETPVFRRILAENKVERARIREGRGICGAPDVAADAAHPGYSCCQAGLFNAVHAASESM
jgi:hypothetical protein